MEVLGPRALNTGSRHIPAWIWVLLQKRDLSIEITSHKVRTPLAKSVVNLKNDSGESLVLGVEIPKRNRVEGVSQELRRGDEVGVRIRRGVHILVC